MGLHVGDKSYKCEQCLKTFPNNYLLNVHQRYYSGLVKDSTNVLHVLECVQLRTI